MFDSRSPAQTFERPMKTDTPPTIRLKDYRPPDFLIDKVDLNIVLVPARTRVDAQTAIRRNPKSENASAPLRLDGEQLELARIAIAGKVLEPGSYTTGDTSLTLNNDASPDPSHWK